MPDQGPGSRFAFWTWVRVVSFSIPWWIAAISAYFSQEAAFRVFQTESKRLAFETTRYTHETYRNYVDYRRDASNKNLTACFRSLVAIADKTPGNFLVSNDDLKWMLAPKSRYVFQYDKARHAELAECMSEGEPKSLIENGMPGISADETANTMRVLRTTIFEKLSANVTVLDAALVGYAHGKADKSIICENFGGFLQTERQLKESGYGVFGTFLLRLIDGDMLRLDNYPNLFRFTADLATISAKFTAPIDCAKLPQRLQHDPGRLDWMWELLALRR